jgi:hypothetical protein
MTGVFHALLTSFRAIETARHNPTQCFLPHQAPQSAAEFEADELAAQDRTPLRSCYRKGRSQSCPPLSRSMRRTLKPSPTSQSSVPSARYSRTFVRMACPFCSRLAPSTSAVMHRPSSRVTRTRPSFRLGNSSARKVATGRIIIAVSQICNATEKLTRKLQEGVDKQVFWVRMTLFSSSRRPLVYLFVFSPLWRVSGVK